MNRYESVIILDPNATEDEIKELVEYIKKLITDNEGTIIKVEELGKKRLAYEVKKNKEGYYIVFEFKVKPEVITELERIYRIKDIVIKFITVEEEN